MLPSIEGGVPLCAVSDQDKMVVCYDKENRVVVYDIINKRVHEWSKRNERMPENFTNRYNRITGIVQISQMKYILYTNYTYIVLDLNQDVPKDQVEIVQNHPGKSVEEKSITAQSWFDSLKLSQNKYLKD